MPNANDYPSFTGGEGDEKPILSQQQKEDFARDGLLIIENFFSEEEAASLDRMALDLEEMPDVKGSIWKYWNMQPPQNGSDDDDNRESRFLDRVECFTDKHKGWNRLFVAKGSRVVRAVSELFGEDAILWKEKMNFKKPGSAGFAPHQDAQV